MEKTTKQNKNWTQVLPLQRDEDKFVKDSVFCAVVISTLLWCPSGDRSWSKLGVKDTRRTCMSFIVGVFLVDLVTIIDSNK